MNRKELLNALSALLPSVASSDAVKELECFKFENDIIRTANEVSIQTIKYFKTGLVCCVYAKVLFKLLSSMSEEEVDLKVTDTELLIKSGTTKGKIKLVESDLFPELMAVGEKYEPHELPDNFKETLDLCRFSMSTDMSKPDLCAIRVSEDFITSTDSYRITRFDINNLIEFMIRDKMLDILLKFDKLISCQLTDKALIFKVSDDCFVIGPILSFEFPNIESMFSDSIELFEFPGEDLKEALERLSIFSESVFKFDRKITLDFNKDLVILSSEEEQHGELVENIPLRGKGKFPVFKISINPMFLLDILKYGKCKVGLSGDRMIEFRTDSFRHVTVLGDIIEN